MQHHGRRWSPNIQPRRAATPAWTLRMFKRQARDFILLPMRFSSPLDIIVPLQPRQQ